MKIKNENIKKINKILSDWNIKKILKKNIKYQSKVIEDFKQKRTSF